MRNVQDGSVHLTFFTPHWQLAPNQAQYLAQVLRRNLNSLGVIPQRVPWHAEPGQRSLSWMIAPNNFLYFYEQKNRNNAQFAARYCEQFATSERPGSRLRLLKCKILKRLALCRPIPCNL